MLVVDDEPVVRMMIAEVVSDLAFEWAEAVDGDSALEILQSERRIDLLVTDIGLPGMNGRQLADAARLLRPGLKVLFVTGYAGPAAPTAETLGGDFALIAKPFGVDALGEKILCMKAGPGIRRTAGTATSSPNSTPRPRFQPATMPRSHGMADPIARAAPRVVTEEKPRRLLERTCRLHASTSRIAGSPSPRVNSYATVVPDTS